MKNGQNRTLYFVDNAHKARLALVYLEGVVVKSQIMKKLRVLLLILLLLALAAGGVWLGNNVIRTDRYVFASARLPAGFDGFRIVQLSDLHGKQFGAGNERLLAAVAAAEPDLVALTGDFVDARCTPADVLPLAEGLTALAPTYFVTGNHEWGSGQAQELLRLLKEAGVICLENRFVSVERGEAHILLAGVADPNGFADQKTPEQLAAEIRAAEPNPFWLLLAHRNNLFEGKYCRLGADLTLSGHGHGGVWRLPFTDGLFDTGLKLFPKCTDGFYRCDDGHAPATVFVSRGLGNSPYWLPRLFNPPQVAVITLKCT